MPKAIGQITIRDENDISIGVSPPLKPVQDQLWLDTSTTPSILKRYSGSKWDIVNDMNDYIASRGENLVTNGTGLLSNNTNFSGFKFDGTEAYNSGGSFADTISTTRYTDEFIPVNPDLNYRFILYGKQKKGNPTKALTKTYFYIGLYDADKLEVGRDMRDPFPNTLTTLARDLKPGDTVAYLTNAANYNNAAGTSTHYRKFIFWGYKNSFGYEYPPETYSRYSSASNVWSDGAVNYVNNTITLRVPWPLRNPKDPDGIWRAGHKVSNGSSGGFPYRGLANTAIPEDWTKYTGVFTKADFGAGTAYIRLAWLNHYSAGQTASTANNNTVMYSNISFNIDYQGPIDEVTSIANGKNTVYYSATPPSGTKVTNDIWFDTDDGHKMYKYQNKAWVAAQFGGPAISATSITGSHIAAETITAGTIAAGAVTSVKIFALSVTADKIAANTITAGKISTSAIEARHIVSNAISTDKITSGAITGVKLNAQSIWADTAFIKNFSAISIDAKQITTGKISGDVIDITGLVSFETLDTTLQPIFDVTGNKTYIHGGMIAANSIKANSIDLLSGMTVYGPDNTVTFSIADNGLVTVNALLQSGNFDESKQTGYQLSTDGTAVLNQALIRGDVILPNAGMTNFGGAVGNENLILNSDFSKSTDWLLSDNVEYAAGGGYNGDNALSLSRTGWVAGQPRTQTAQSLSLPGGAAGKQYTMSTWVFLDNSVPRSSTLNNVCLRVFNTNGLFIADLGVIDLNSDIVGGKWLFFETTFQLPVGFSNSTKPSVIMALNQNGRVKFSKIKLEPGDKATPWCPAKNEQINYTRIWAGSSYSGRNDAPFRVMQNGTFYANDAVLSGVLYGRVDSGFVNIDKKQLSIVDDTTVPSKEYVRMNDLIAMFDVDFRIGTYTDKMIDISRVGRTITTEGVNTTLTGRQTSMVFNSDIGSQGGLSLVGVTSGGRHLIRHSNDAGRVGTLIFNSQGSRPDEADFTFTRMNYSEQVNVLVDGFLKVKHDIKSTTHNIEMRSVPNEGWAFYTG